MASISSVYGNWAARSSGTSCPTGGGSSGATCATGGGAARDLGGASCTTKPQHMGQVLDQVEPAANHHANSTNTAGGMTRTEAAEQAGISERQQREKVSTTLLFSDQSTLGTFGYPARRKGSPVSYRGIAVICSIRVLLLMAVIGSLIRD